MKKSDLIFACALMLLAVILGAFGAHALKEHLSIESLESYKTGVRYQMFHAIALLIFSLPAFQYMPRKKLAMNLFKIGIVLFSFSIYILTVGKMMDSTALSKIMGPFTPIGGLCLIVAWALLIFGILKSDFSRNEQISL